MSQRSKLIAEADRVFSLFIRRRGSQHGMNHCFTCGSYLAIEDLQCGHFRPRRYLSTRWHPFNCWPQCNRCNVELGGNLRVYEARLVAAYGQGAVDGIYLLSRGGAKTAESDIRAVIAQYRA